MDPRPYRRVVLTAIAAPLISWFAGFLHPFDLSPQRSLLVLANEWQGTPPPSEDGFRIILCWLENDHSGKDAETVEDAFSDVGGIKLFRSARVVAASGAADDWKPAMQESANAVLDDWNADLAIAGKVMESGEVLRLWFVSRLGEGTLDRGDDPYRLNHVTLGADFHEDLRAQITATALAAVAPLSDTEARGRVLDEGLREAAEKLSALLDNPPVARSDHLAALHQALGTALRVLGEREGNPARLEQAVEAFRAALGELIRERTPLDWARTQNNLGERLVGLG